MRFPLEMRKSAIEFHRERLRLTLPLSDAVPFAIGWSDLGYRGTADHLRHVVGILATDALQRREQ